MGKVLIIPGADFSANRIPSKFGISVSPYSTKKIRSGVTSVSGNWNSIIWTDEVITNVVFDENGFGEIPTSFSLGRSAIGAFACDTGSSQTSPISGNVVKNWNLSALDTSLVQDMTSMFAYNTELQTLVIPFNTSAVRSVREMFRGCNKIKKLNLTSFTISDHHDLLRTFQDCISLQEIVYSESYDFSLANFNNTFLGCTSLSDIYAPSVVASEYQTLGTGAYKLVTALTGLADSGSCPTITIHCTNSAKLVYTKASNTWSVA